MLWVILNFQKTVWGKKKTDNETLNWSAKFHLKNVGMFGCQVRKERRERGAEREKESSRKDKGMKVRTVTPIFCNPSA